MKKALSVAAVSVLLVLFGCGEPEPEVESTTLVESQPDEFLAEPEPEPLTTDPLATETVDPAPAPAETPAPAPAATTETAEGAPGELPRTHNVDLGGAMHAPGYDSPTRRCASCHGADLRGGRRAESSCFDCHDQTWD